MLLVFSCLYKDGINTVLIKTPYWLSLSAKMVSMAKRFVADILQVAQVPINTLTVKTVVILAMRAAYMDIETELREFMISVNSIEELLPTVETEVKEELQALLSEVKDFHYVNVICI